MTYEDGYQEGYLDAKYLKQFSNIKATWPNDEFARGYRRGYSVWCYQVYLKTKEKV